MISLKNLSFVTLSILFLIIIHLWIENFGSPILIPTAYLIWMGAAFFILIATVYAIKMSVFTEPLIMKYILLFICLSLLTTLFNPVLNYHTFLYRTLGLTSGVIFFIALHQFKLLTAERDKLLFIIFISGVIEAGIGMIQYFAPFLRIPFITPAKTTVFGSFQQVNVFSSYIATALVISLFLISRPLFKKLAANYKLYYFFFVAALSFILFSSQSSVGFYGAVLGFFVLFVSRKRIYRRILTHSVCWLAAVSIGISCSYVIEKKEFKRTPSQLSYGTTKVSVNIRKIFFETSYEMFKEKPFFGHGSGNFGSKYLYYLKDVLKKNPEYIAVMRSAAPATYTTHPHNEVLYRLVESGLVGITGLLILFFAFAYLIFRLGMERGGMYLSFILPIGLHTQTEFPLYTSIGHFILFLVLCYLPSSHFCKRFPIRINRIVKSVVLVFTYSIFILTTVFFVKTLIAHRGIVKYHNLLYSKGEIRPGLLIPAIDNGYLRQIAMQYFMDARLRIGLAENNMNLIRDFVKWSRNERKVTPYSSLHEKEAIALNVLGLKSDAFKIIDEGLSLYPTPPDKQHLMETKMTFIIDEIKTKLSYKNKGETIKEAMPVLRRGIIY